MAAQRAIWSRIAVLEESTQRANQARRKKKSEKRQRTERITVRLLPAERTALEHAAQFLNLSMAELVRRSSLDYLHVFEHQLKTRRDDTR